MTMTMELRFPDIAFVEYFGQLGKRTLCERDFVTLGDFNRSKPHRLSSGGKV